MVATTERLRGLDPVCESGGWATGLDLRRRHGRGEIEQILARARFLPPSDEALVRAYYDEGNSVADISRLSGACPRSLRRRLRRVVERVVSPIYAFVAIHREEWPGSRRRVATACVLEGKTLRDAATSLGLSLHTVRRHHDAIRALYEAERDSH